MGIKDLLRFMKPFIESVHIKKYAGKRVGIDAYSWLHKGAYSCSMEICLNSKSERRSRYIDYFMHRINLLRFHKITPVVVFDGANIPCKADTENERQRRRKENKELAMAKLKEGDVKGATELFQRAVSITPAMAYQLIQILRSENVEFVVAPYEADAQLAYLATLEHEKGGVAAVITEDSDLIAYGCPAITFKMDRYGNGEELVLDKVFDSVTSKPSFRNFDKELFIGMCVLAGCDFLPSVPGIGIVTAHSMVSKYRNLDRVLSILKIEKGSQMPENYSKSFKEAISVFQHARIYDAEIKGIKHMKPLTEQLLKFLDGLDFLGPEIPPSEAAAIAEGDLDPMSMKAFDSSHLKSNRRERKTTGSMRQTATFSKRKYFQDVGLEKLAFPLKPCEEKEKGSVKQTAAFSERKYFQDVGLEKLAFPLKPCEEKEKGSMKQTDAFSEREYFQGFGLEKLAFPLKPREEKENLVIDEIPLKFPDNNPFKKRKVIEITHVSDANDMAELVSSKDDEILCAFPDGKKLTFPANNNRCIMSETKFEVSSQMESLAEQNSTVTEVETSNTQCINVGLGSQESVNSNPKKVFSGSGKNDRSKSISNKKSVTKNSILNFFVRV